MSDREPSQIIVNQKFYDDFNTAILNTHGAPFTDLATERPADAYKLLTRVVEGVAGTADSITTSEGTTVSKKMDGEAAVSGFARHAIRETAQDTDTEAFDVVVSVFQKPKLRDIIRGRETDPKKVITIHVEPPNLAF